MTDIPIETVGGERELDLTPDRVPRNLWIAAGIPIFTAALMFWLRGHWQELSYRGYANDPDWLWRRNAYNTMVQGILTFLVFEMWLVAYGLAHWYGTARTSDRNQRFNLWLANAWSMALCIPAIQFAVNLDLSWRGIALCVTPAAVGYAVLAVVAWRVRDQGWKLAPDPGFYFDRHDPALAGPRGLNLGNPWQWALIVTGLLPSLVILLLMRLQLR